MRKIYSFLAVFLLSALTSVGMYAQNGDDSPYGEYDLWATNDAEDNLAVEDFAIPLQVTDKWSIHAETLYKGQPAHTTWGSRLFHVMTDNNTNDGPYAAQSVNMLNWYMRPSVGGTDSNRGRLLLRNAAITPVLNIDTQNGTLFTFDVISDGTGTVYANVTINNELYSTVYEAGKFTQITSLHAGQCYDVHVTVSEGESAPILSKPSNIDFGVVMKNFSKKQTLKVEGINLHANITGVIGGADASAFTVTPSSIATGGSLEITFTPTEPKEYNATLTVSSDGAESKTCTLTGNADFTLPLEISALDGSTEHWYYLQFTRRTAENKVIQGNGLNTLTTQAYAKNDPAQLWKIIGDWDNYYIVNKDNSELDYVQGNDQYNNVETEGGDKMGFVRNASTGAWQIYNLSTAFLDTTKHPAVEVATKRYLNDSQGKQLCAYNANDAGNALTFWPENYSDLLVGSDSVACGKLAVAESAVKKIWVVGLGLSGNINYSIEGDASAFNVQPVSSALTAAGDTVVITFTPDAAKTFSAKVTFTIGNISKSVTLTGTGVQLPVRISSADDSDEHWYYIQFIRRAGDKKVVQSNGAEAEITQEVKVEDNTSSPSLAQQWKFIGTWDKYQIVSNLDDGALYIANATNDARYSLKEVVAEADKFRFETNADGAWALYNMTVSKHMNDNNGAKIGNWTLDAGGVFNFIPVSDPTIVPKSANIDFKVEVGASLEKTLPLSAYNLTDAISYTLEGSDEDKAAFNLSGTAAPTLLADTLTITFTPTEKRVYKVNLVLKSAGAVDVIVPLTGTADFNLPVKISTEGNDYWYYIQFTRRAADNKVLAADIAGSITVIQAARQEADSTQLWKIVSAGQPAQYRIQSASDDYAIALNPALGPETSGGLFELVNVEDGDAFQFIPSSSDKWQLRDVTTQTTDEENVTGRFLNDFEGKGEYAGLYADNDGGNALTFIRSYPLGNANVKVEGNIEATYYYNLQGLRVSKDNLLVGNIYIKKDVYDTKQTKVTKIMVVK